jgi:hypothetical protein
VRLQVEVDAARRDQLRPRLRRAERQRQRRHRHCVRIVGVDDRRRPLPDDLRQLPRRGEIDFVHRGERHQVGPLGGAPEQLALFVRNEYGAVPAGPHAENG